MAATRRARFVGTVADTQYVKEQGMAGRLGHQLMATACSKTSVRGKIYIPVDSGTLDENQIRIRIQSICDQQGLSIPREPIVNDAKKALFCVLYGLVEWGHLFSPRQMLCLMEFTAAIRRAEAEIRNVTELAGQTAVTVLLAAMLDRPCRFFIHDLRLELDGGRANRPHVWKTSITNDMGLLRGSTV